MMLATTNFVMSAGVAAVSIFSPSRNSCIKRVAPMRFRFDPYAAHVLPQLHAAAACTPTMSTPTEGLESYALQAAVSPSASRTTFFLANTAAVAESMTFAAPTTEVTTTFGSTAIATNSNATSGAFDASVVRKSSAAPRFAIVKFKHESATFLAPFRIAVNDTVVVEGDRGESIGVVAEITQEQPAYAVPCRVLRRATDKDLTQLADQRQREAAAVLATQALANSLNLNATIEDAEYQFDGHKLTIFVRRAARNAFVDFRKLQRGLFREFRCRIWCAYMDEVEAVEAAPRSR